MSQKNRILTVVHQEVSTPGLLGRNLIARGYELDRFCPCIGDQLPRDLSAYKAVIVFGGPQSATDDNDPGIKAELNWIEKTVLSERWKQTFKTRLEKKTTENIKPRLLGK